MSTKKHLPLMGVGPIYVLSIIFITILGVYLSNNIIFKDGEVVYLRIPFIIIGVLLISIGIILWASANFQSKLDYNVKNNTLVTTGVYAYVRNPIYSAFMMACTGALLINNNYYLLILPILFWIIMTILMKNTEEKWLANLYGKKYLLYCKQVNRCIPFIKRKKVIN